MSPKDVVYPVYTVEDGGRPSPNFAIDRGPTWSLLLWTNEKEAAAFAMRNRLENPTLIKFETEAQVRGVIQLLKDFLPKLQWVMIDPPDVAVRRPTRIRVSEFLKTAKSQG